MKDFLDDEDNVLEASIGFPLISETFESHLSHVLVTARWDIDVDMDCGGASLAIKRSMGGLGSRCLLRVGFGRAP